MRLSQALAKVQSIKRLTTNQNLVIDFFIKAEDDYLRKAKRAIRKLYRETYGYLKSVIIPHYELIKFIFDTLPTVVKVLLMILPLVLQRKYQTNAA